MDEAKLRWLDQFPGQRDLDEIDRDLSDRIGETKNARRVPQRPTTTWCCGAKGKRKGQHSIRINDQWRICFVWADGNANKVEIVDYH